jgi:uncharacterized membrane protein
MTNNLRNGLLAASLAINLMLLGAMAGQWLQQSDAQKPPMEWATRDLSDRARRITLEALNQNGPQARAIRRELRKIDRQLIEIIRAEDLDELALKDALKARQEKNEAYQTLLTASLEAVLPPLQPIERERVLKRMLRGSAVTRPPHPKPPHASGARSREGERVDQPGSDIEGQPG